MINVLFSRVNPKWKEARRLQPGDILRESRALVGAIGLVVLWGLIFLAFNDIGVQWKISIGVLIFSPFLLHFGLKDLIEEGSPNVQLLSVIVILIALLLTIAAGLSFPQQGSLSVLDWRFMGIGLMPLVSGLLIFRAGWGAPSKLRALGYQPRLWFAYAIEGGLAGLALGGHLIYVLGFLPFGGYLGSDALGIWKVIWWGSVVGALLSPVEELAIRGRAIVLFRDRAGFSKNRILVLSVALSFLVWLPLTFTLWPVPVAVVFLGYRMVLALLNTYVRLHERSLTFGIASNLGFSLLAGWVLLA